MAISLWKPQLHGPLLSLLFHKMVTYHGTLYEEIDNIPKILTFEIVGYLLIGPLYLVRTDRELSVLTDVLNKKKTLLQYLDKISIISKISDMYHYQGLISFI